MSENVIKLNFFGLSFSRQIQILDLYLNDMKLIDSYDECRKIFEKYILVVNKFSFFKNCFFTLSDDDRKKMRYLIDRCRVKINPNNEVRGNDFGDFPFCSSKIDDGFVDEYIYESFSYSKQKRVSIASDFFNYYSEIFDYDFEGILGLFNYNRDFFNKEIRKVSHEFYSLYLLMNTVDRMKYVWYLSNFEMFCSEHVSDNEIDMYGVFNSDSKFIKPLHLGSKESDNSKILAKYFNLDK